MSDPIPGHDPNEAYEVVPLDSASTQAMKRRAQAEMNLRALSLGHRRGIKGLKPSANVIMEYFCPLFCPPGPDRPS
jgi:hypothetical protein